MMLLMRAQALGIAAAALGLWACGAKLDGAAGVDGAPDDGGGPGDDLPPPDSGLGPFGSPLKIDIAATTAAEDDGTLSSDGLELVWAVVDATDGNRKKLFYAQRATTADVFANAMPVPFTTTGVDDETPRFSADDKTLFFGSNRTGTVGGLDIFQVSHPSAGNNFGTPAHVDNVNGPGTDKWFMECGTNGRYLLSKNNDLAEGLIDDAGGPTTVAELSSAGGETGTFLFPDCKTILFASSRNGPNQIFIATRASETSAWNTPVLITQDPAFAQMLPLGGNQQDPWLSGDGKTFVMVSDISGTNDEYILTR